MGWRPGDGAGEARFRLGLLLMVVDFPGDAHMHGVPLPRLLQQKERIFLDKRAGNKSLLFFPDILLQCAKKP
jgi:hypothetical protein